jgi:predicted O-methyltransferase YrrM
MTGGGTSAYRDMKYLPPLVHGAVKLAADQGFDHSCAPEQGRLLSVLARGWSGGRVGETGTGYGVGLAWMVEAAAPSTSFVSIEKDPHRVAATQSLFAAHPQVRILSGDWTDLVGSGPFDLLVLDGGGKGQRSIRRPATRSHCGLGHCRRHHRPGRLHSRRPTGFGATR